MVRRASVVSPNDVLAGFYSNIIDDFNGECLAIRVKRKLNLTHVINTLTVLFVVRGVPAYIRSGNGPKFILGAVRLWIKGVGAKTAYREPGSRPGRTATARASTPVSGTNS